MNIIEGFFSIFVNYKYNNQAKLFLIAEFPYENAKNIF